MNRPSVRGQPAASMTKVVTRPINLDVEVDRKLAGTGQRVGFKATGAIDRRDFGMNTGYPVISETVHLIVTTEVVGEP